MAFSIRKIAATAVILATPLSGHAQDDVAGVYRGKAVTAQIGSESDGGGQ